MLENFIHLKDEHIVETFGELKPMNILVLGHGGHGKGTVCKLLKKFYGMESLSSSEAAWPYIWPAFRIATGDLYETEAEAYRNKNKHRSLLKELILLYNTPDKTRLAKLILNSATVYDGMRAQEEFEACSNLFDLVVWVDASGRVGPDVSMEIEQPPGAVVISNNGSIRDLQEEILSIFQVKITGVRPGHLISL